MIYKIAICDDEPDILSLLNSFLVRISIETDIDFDVHHFKSGNELLTSYNYAHSFDIIFLDIEMNGFNGIETAIQIRNIPDDEVEIVILTYHSKYFKGGFKIHAFDYLIKPLSYSNFSKTINSIIKKRTKAVKTMLFTTVNNTNDVGDVSIGLK